MDADTIFIASASHLRGIQNNNISRIKYYVVNFPYKNNFVGPSPQNLYTSLMLAYSEIVRTMR